MTRKIVIADQLAREEMAHQRHLQEKERERQVGWLCMCLGACIRVSKGRQTRCRNEAVSGLCTSFFSPDEQKLMREPRQGVAKKMFCTQLVCTYKKEGRSTHVTTCTHTRV
jgi:hypothetical protein